MNFNEKMANKILIWLVIVIIISIGGYLWFSGVFGGAVVSATGTSVIKVEPDLVSVNVNVETRGESAQEAQEKNKEISGKLLVEIIKLGYDKDELKFVNYNVYPEYDYNYSSGQQKLRGYVVSQQLVVKTSEVRKVPEIIDTSINSGALISYINFELSEEKQNEYKKQVLEEAGKDAKEKASAIAVGVGKKIGRLVSVQSQDFGYRPIVLYDKAVAEASGKDIGEEARKSALNISPQDLEVSATIVVQYKLRGF